MKNRKKRWMAIGLCMVLLGMAGCAEPGVTGGNQTPTSGAASAGNAAGENNPGQGSAGGNETGQGNAGGELVKTGSRNLMSGITAQDIDLTQPKQSGALTDFGVRFFKTTMNYAEADENVLISPLSVMLAMYMTLNGAAGETKAQMEAVLGADLNDDLYAYRLGLPQGEGYKLHVANGIWFKDKESLTVNQDFLQTNKNYFDAAVYRAPFDDTTLEEINTWVEENTDGMIKDMLDRIVDDAVLYLVNALSFDAEWQEIYSEYDLWDGTFTKEDGTEQAVQMMHSEESVYLEDEKATGFIKYYKGRKYAFVGLLPKEGVSVSDYAKSLTGEHVSWLLTDGKTDGTVSVSMPKFETEYDILLNDVLVQMGMPDAFNPYTADFSAMAVSTDGNIFINRVIHKTFISVDEKGTKAGASTVVEMTDESAAMDLRFVRLDRPFVYMLIDCEENVPFFIGTMMDVEN